MRNYLAGPTETGEGAMPRATKDAPANSYAATPYRSWTITAWPEGSTWTSANSMMLGAALTKRCAQSKQPKKDAIA